MKIGLGDAIEAITTTTGIKKAVEFLEEKLNFDCGCEARKEKLNKIFPFNKIECLTEEEFNYLNNGLDVNTIDTVKQRKLLDIYNRIFNTNQQMTQCGSCWRNIIEKLKQIHSEYKQN